MGVGFVLTLICEDVSLLLVVLVSVFEDTMEDKVVISVSVDELVLVVLVLLGRVVMTAVVKNKSLH